MHHFHREAASQILQEKGLEEEATRAFITGMFKLTDRLQDVRDKIIKGEGKDNESLGQENAFLAAAGKAL